MEAIIWMAVGAAAIVAAYYVWRIVKKVPAATSSVKTWLTKPSAATTAATTAATAATIAATTMTQLQADIAAIKAKLGA